MVSTTIPTMEIVLFRSIVTFFIIAGYMLKRRYSFKAKNIPLLALRGLFGGIGLLGFFFMLSRIKLAEAGIIFQLIPVFVVILSWIFLREKLRRIELLLLLTSVVGAILVIKPGAAIGQSLPALIGLFSALVAAGAYICIRFLSRDHHSYIIILFFALGSITVSVIPAIIYFVLPSFNDLLLLFGIGITSALAQIAMTKAYSRERAGPVAMVGHVGVVFNISWGYLFWREVLDLYSWIGGSLIVGACIILNLNIGRKGKKAADTVS